MSSPSDDSTPSNLLIDRHGPVTVVTINRPEVRNAVDGPTAAELHRAFEEFDADENAKVAILTGAQGTFCAGADLKAIAGKRGNRVETRPPEEIMGSFGPVGPSRLLLSKPTIAAVEGFAVAGGLELAVWCDMRVMAADASFGVFCRRWGVPLVDGGTIRLPRLIGHSRAMDLILTGREVGAEESLQMGLANRVVEPGHALDEALALANHLSTLPQTCMRSDRLSAYHQWDLGLAEALSHETDVGLATINTGETRAGAARFAGGEGRSGAAAPLTDN